MNASGGELDAAQTRMVRLALAEPRPDRERGSYDEAVEIREYVVMIISCWRLIFGVVVAAMALTLLVTKFVMTRWYRAEAILRPIAIGSVQNRLSGVWGGLGGLGGSSGLAGGLLGSEAANPASEYTPVLESFQFTTRLVASHGLKSHLQYRSWIKRFGVPGDPDWARYRVMRRRFDCEFSVRTGNLTLYYEDPDRVMAGKILGYYVSDLRELLRHAEVHDTGEAIASLRSQIAHTADNLLQTQLYELLARQIQQQKLAQVQADFAFKVLQASTVSDRPYSPRVILDTLLVGILALILSVAGTLWCKFVSPTRTTSARP